MQYLPHHYLLPQEAAGLTITAPLGAPEARASSLSPTRLTSAIGRSTWTPQATCNKGRGGLGSAGSASPLGSPLWL